jgi:hypothetical protein
MNDLSDIDGDAERDRQLVDLRVNGKSVGDICALFSVTPQDITRALDRAAQEALTPRSRVRMIHVEQARIEMIEEAFLPAAKGGDDRAAQVVIRAQERKATLLGLNAPVHMHVDPIALALEAKPRENSVQNLHRVWLDGNRITGRWRELEDRAFEGVELTPAEADELDAFREAREFERRRKHDEERAAREARRANGGG